MPLLTRKQLLEKELLQVVKVDLGGDDFIYVKQMTGRDRDRFEQSILKEKEDEKGKVTYERSLEDFRAKLAVLTVCDEKGELLFRPEDYSTLSANMSANRLEKIITKAQKLNRISEQDREKLVKNSESDRDDNSPSVSVAS